METWKNIKGDRYQMSNLGNIRALKKSRNLSEQQRKGISERRAKLVLNLATGIYYDSVKEAANAANLLYPTLCSCLNGANPNKTNFIFV
jgi:hypothetical protein